MRIDLDPLLAFVHFLIKNRITIALVEPLTPQPKIKERRNKTITPKNECKKGEEVEVKEKPMPLAKKKKKNHHLPTRLGSQPT